MSMQENHLINLAHVANEVENWDEDGDLDFSSVVSGEALRPSSTNRLSIDSIASVIEPSIEIPPLDGIRGFRERDVIQEDDYNDDDEEEQGDTLKVSDLTSETLAQLAAYAKKKKGTGNIQDKPNDDDNFQPNQNQSPFAIAQDQPVSMHTYLQNVQDDWNEDLEIPESFSMQSLKVRNSSSASENDFETPSLSSTSDGTSLSISSDHQGSFDPSQPLTPQKQQHDKQHPMAFEVQQSIPNSGLTMNDTKLRISEDEEGFALPAQVRALQLNSGRGRIVSSQSETSWGSPASSNMSRHGANLSIGGSINSEQSADKVEEDFDDLDFDSFEQVEHESPKGKEGKQVSLAEQLRARLQSRSKGTNQKESLNEFGSDKSIAGNEETDLTSGLVITDDMDLSPSRLKARNLSNRLREAAHSRRKRHDGKSLQVAVTDGKGKERGQGGQSTNVDRRQNSLTINNSNTANTGRPSSPLAKFFQKSNLHNEGLPSSSSNTKSYVGRWTEGITGRFGTSRPSTPNRGEPVSGKVSTLHAGSMGYTMPTAASLARSTGIQDGSSLSVSESSVRSPKVLRKPRKPRKYGDGKELDGIDDLPTSNAKSLTLSEKPKRFEHPNQSRQRKKKQPVLIRNLGGAGTVTKTVGEMRWNPNLKKWEGNEQEGRDFENAIRGTGRPALITQLSFAPMKGGSDGIIQSPPRSVSSSSTTNQSIKSPPTASTLRIVGEMAFDPIKLCWVRQDGQEEVDPFESMADESDTDLDIDSGPDDEIDYDQLQVRKLRQRTASAEILRQVAGGIEEPSNFNLENKTVEDAVDRYRMILNTIRLSNSSEEKEKEVRMPNELKSLIPESLWKSTISAQKRHIVEMAGFQKRDVLDSSKSSFPQSQIRERDGSLYLIQSLARRAPRGP